MIKNIDYERGGDSVNSATRPEIPKKYVYPKE
jgi:hypothetical protein